MAELKTKFDLLQETAGEARLLKDELDILRDTADRVEKYESTIQSYKKKLEELGDLKRQVKILETKNIAYIQQNMELEQVKFFFLDITTVDSNIYSLIAVISIEFLIISLIFLKLQFLY